MARRTLKLYSALSVEAHLLRSLLAHHGVEAAVHNDTMSVYGTNPAEVWIDAEDLETARVVLEAFVARPEGEGRLSIAVGEGGELGLSSADGALAVAGDVPCPSCKQPVPAGFGECWSCGATMGG